MGKLFLKIQQCLVESLVLNTLVDCKRERIQDFFRQFSTLKHWNAYLLESLGSENRHKLRRQGLEL
jgi:hypothetical protein